MFNLPVSVEQENRERQDQERSHDEPSLNTDLIFRGIFRGVYRL
jgi:hypothetical protein